MCPVCKLNPIKKGRLYCSRGCYNKSKIGKKRPDVSLRNKTNNPIWDKINLEKMRKSLTGKRQTEKTKSKRSKKLTEYYQNNPKPLGWPNLKKLIKERDKNVCQLCLDENKTRVFIVHRDGYRGERQLGHTLTDTDPAHYVTCCHVCFNKERKTNFSFRHIYKETLSRSQIPLGHGVLTSIDEVDFDFLSKYNWYLSCGYAVTYKSGKAIKMHRMILGTTEEELVDHKDLNPLNNKRKNLRVATHSDNVANSKIRKNNTSGYKGVTIVRSKSRATISGRHIGYYDTPEQAARAYDEKARELFGEFGRFNFPKDDEMPAR